MMISFCDVINYFLFIFQYSVPVEEGTPNAVSKVVSGFLAQGTKS
jgi:hypothetical protein